MCAECIFLRDIIPYCHVSENFSIVFEKECGYYTFIIK